MEKRVLLAVSLSFVVLLVYQTLFVKPAPRKAPTVPSRPTSSAPVSAPTQGTQAPAASPALPAVASVTTDSSEREIVIETGAVRALFSNRGAELRSWRLKNYFDATGSPIDIIPAGGSPNEPRALSLVTGDDQLDQRLRSALYRASAARLNPDTGDRRLVFAYEDAAGLKVSKTFEFGPGNHPYVVSVSAAVSVKGTVVPVALSSGPGIGDTARAVTSTSAFSPSYYQKTEALIQRGRDVERLGGSKLQARLLHEGVFTCVGSDDQYFLAAVLPDNRNTRVDYETLAVTTPAGPRDLVRFKARVAGGLTNVRVFLGPKQYDALAAVDRELVRTINFGMFDWLVVPLLQALKWVDRYVGNFGWSIIILTLLINGLIAPLRHRSVVSMRKMQEIQPQVKAIQDRYANLKASDPEKQKMNAELMDLYRARGVNPASGCVPLVLTMPILFAFYAMLSQAIELRGAPFIGWIHDLSTHDPYYVTPLLMGASMVIQQRMSPSTADPVQQRVMMFMPLMFTFMFIWAPSGLVIYWLMSNLWAIGQQYVTNRIIGPAKVPPVRATAVRKAK